MLRFLLKSVWRLAALAAAVTVLVVAALAAGLMNLPSATPRTAHSTGEAVGAAKSPTGGCAAAAGRFADLIASRDPAWTTKAVPLVTTSLAAALPSVDVADLPVGTVGVVKTDGEPDVCDANVTIGGAPLRLELAAVNGAWLVSSWDVGS